MSEREPDFDRLARETMWTAETWRWVWDYLEPHGDLRPRLWENVMAFVRNGSYGPRAAASMLIKALIIAPDTTAAEPRPQAAGAEDEGGAG
jgi:hypothetical protein